MKNKTPARFLEQPEIKKLLAKKSFKKAVDDEYLMLLVSHRLADLRIMRGLSQRALAKITRMPQQEINDIEHGKRNLTIKTINRIASALNSRTDIRFIGLNN
jgi:DNA-binding XRE family transcriptional regulator